MSKLNEDQRFSLTVVVVGIVVALVLLYVGK
jgi:hypothetical protein